MTTIASASTSEDMNYILMNASNNLIASQIGKVDGLSVLRQVIAATVAIVEGDFQRQLRKLVQPALEVGLYGL